MILVICKVRSGGIRAKKPFSTVEKDWEVAREGAKAKVQGRKLRINVTAAGVAKLQPLPIFCML